MDVGQLKPEIMAEHVGSEFEVLDDPANIFPVKFTEIVEHSKTEHNHAFSLFFHGPLDRLIQQGIHKLKHPGLGEFEIFLVPVARDKDGFQYEAAFNQILS
jgi:hypothetical protein